MKSIEKYTNKLSILISRDGFYYLSNRMDRIVSEYVYIDSLSYSKYLNQLEYYLSEKKILTLDYQKVDVILSTDNFTIVPNDFFSEDLCDKYLELKSEIHSRDIIRYNIDLDYKNVFVFSYDESIEKILEDKYKNITYFHSMFKFLKNINIKGNNNQKQFHINFYTNYSEVILVSNNNILSFTTPKYNSKDDLSYHLLNLLEQYKIPKEEVEILFYGNININDQKLQFLKSIFPNVNFGLDDIFQRNFITLQDVI